MAVSSLLLLLLLLLMVLVVVVVMLKRQLVAAISVTSLHLRSSCRVSQLVIARRRSVAAARRRRRRLYPPLHAAVWCVVAGAVISRCGVVLVAVPSLPRQIAGARQLPGVAAATDSDHPHALHRNNISIYY